MINWETNLTKFDGGWITNLGRLEQGIQAPGSATILQNFEVNVDGGYSKILGYTKYCDDVVPGTGDVISVIVLNESDCLARRNQTYYLSNSISWTSVITAPNTGSTRTHHVRYNFDGTEKFLIVDGVNDPLIYNTGTNSAAYDTSAPVDVIGATLVTVFSNHIFFAKNNLVTFTAPYTDTDYDTGNGAGVINLGSDCTGMVVFRDQLILFSRDSIQYLSGTTSSDFVLKSITDNTGCLCPNTIAEVGGDILYLGPDGIRWLSATEKNEDFGLERASKNIQDNITSISNTNCGYTAITLPSKSQYRLFTNQSGVSETFSKCFVATKFSDQDTTNIQWSLIQGIKMYAGDARQFRDSEVILFSTSTGYVYQLESGFSFDGAPIEAIFETPFIPIKDPRIRKTYYKHSLYCKVGGVFSLIGALKYDYRDPKIIQPPAFVVSENTTVGSYYGDSSSVYGAAYYGGPTDELFTTNVVGSSFTVAFRYRDVSTNPPFILDYATLEYSTNERR